MIEFNPTLAELTRSGATAAMLLDAQKRLCALCVEEVLRKVDRATMTSSLTPELAIALVSELAAYRRIVYRQQQEIDAGRAAAARRDELGAVVPE